jgi:eukaryotic-like serine/threonine-protein kinase
MKCFRCGATVAEGSSFCGKCGTQVMDPEGSTLALPPVDDSDSLLHRVRHVFAGEYDVESEIGRGGMAVVFKAIEVAVHRPVALKVLPPELGLTVKAVERFKREGRLAGALDHPDITPVYRAGQTGGLLHIAMKYVEGRSLDRILEDQGALPIPVVLAVLRAAARALTYAHERDIVHRDVKGANILVDRDGRVLVSDFGVALQESDVTLTAAGTVIGTPAYMAPEQCAGRRALPQSDQYSLGVVAFQMLTGSVPFRSETLAGIMQHHFFTPIPDLSRVRHDIPARLIDVVNRMLAKDPAQRFASTRELLIAIGAVPYTETERHESERLLRELARGTVIDRVRTEEIPAPPDIPTMLIEPAPPHAVRWTRTRAASALAAFALIASVALWARGAGRPPAVSPPPDSVLAPESAAVADGPRTEDSARTASTAPARGKLRLLTSPPDARILVDGRMRDVGSLFDHPVAPGSHRISVQAAGYRSFDTTVVVASGATVSLGRVRLEVLGPQ